MSTTTLKKSARRKAGVSREYLALVKRFPLRPIRTDAEYDRAAEMLDSLVLRTLSAGERDYLDALTRFIEDFDGQHYPTEPDKRPPHERLRSLVQDNNVSHADLQQILGVAQSTVSMLLSGRRALSKSTIMKLSERFKLSPAYFM